LTVDGQTQTQPLKVIMDPRSPATSDVLQQQLQLGKQIYAEIIKARRALTEISLVQKQLADAEHKLGEQNAALKSALAGAQSEVAKILTEEKPPQPSGGLQEGSTELASALRVVEGGDRALPSQAIAVYEESSRRVKKGIEAWTVFKQTNLLGLNQTLREAGLAPIATSESTDR
jgi:hypothetical protein